MYQRGLPFLEETYVKPENMSKEYQETAGDLVKEKILLRKLGVEFFKEKLKKVKKLNRREDGIFRRKDVGDVKVVLDEQYRRVAEFEEEVEGGEETNMRVDDLLTVNAIEQALKEKRRKKRFEGEKRELSGGKYSKYTKPGKRSRPSTDSDTQAHSNFGFKKVKKNSSSSKKKSANNFL